MTEGNLKIHSENILPIIKKWLYSDKDIFLRELVSNACDATSKLKILRDQGKVAFQDEELKIEIQIDKENRLIKVIDTGIGMTADEVEKYIAQLAFSGAEEFMNKYQSGEEKDQIIGHFGLGFYSSFMVSDRVEINTLSYEDGAKSAHWSCDGSSSYDLTDGTRASRGTEIILHIGKDDEEFLEETRLKNILQKHCSFLPVPISLNETQINTKEPLWIKAPSECTEQEYLEFYRHLYPFEPDPMFWVHLNVDYPFHLKGILYFPKITKQFDFQKSQLDLYCNRVFVSDQCKDLIPDYLTILRGIIDSPDIPLNVSRSYLQMDRTVRQLSGHISKKISDKLKTLYTTDKDKYIACLPDIEMIIKLGCLQDDKFYERIKDALLWKTTEGEWTNLEEYIGRHQEAYDQKIFYHNQDESLETHFLTMYKEKGIEVLISQNYMDTPLFSFLETKLTPVKFQRIDGGIDTLILDKEREKGLLDAEGKTEASKIADYFRTHLEEVEIEAKSLSSDTLPAFLMLKEESRRMRDYLALSQQELPPNLLEKPTFVVNTNNNLINSIYSLKEKQPDLAKTLVTQLYQLSLLTQKELKPADLSTFIKQSNEVLETLAEQATHS